MRDWDIRINRGILTGYNEAFIIDKDKRDELVEQDPKSAEIIRPILRGRDIKKYGYEFANLYLIYIPWHFPMQDDVNIKGASLEAEKLFEKNYLSVYAHLSKYKENLIARNKAETGIRYEWYALQRWGANYWDDFFNPKIVFSEMVQSPQFYFDKDDFIVNDTVTFISGENLDVLIKCLNSHFIFEIYKRFYAGGGLGDQGIRLKKTFIQNLPIPYDIKFESENEDSIDGTIIQKIGLNQEEIHFLRYGH